MPKTQTELINIPVTAQEFNEVKTRAQAHGSSLENFCRGLIGLEENPTPETATGDGVADALVAVLTHESQQSEEALTRLKRAPSTDPAELDRALAVVRDAIDAERAFALEARLAFSAMERDED